MSLYSQSFVSLLIAGLISAVSLPSHAQQDPVDPLLTQCEGYAGDPAPGTPEFVIRDLQNIYCSEQRHVDLQQHPVNYQRQLQLYGSDPYREPQFHDGVRFRHDSLSIAGAEGDVFRPCSAGDCTGLPEGLSEFQPPYPVVIALHGAASDKDHLWWATQPLAERGYFVVTVNGTGNSLPFDVLNWLHTEAQTLYPGDLDLNRVGITGHSLGAENSTRTQGDPRVSAIIGWDPCNSPFGCTNSPGSRLHDKGAEAKTPTLFIAADYSGFPGYAQPRTSVPGTLRVAGFSTLRDNGVDSMLITPRATTHLDWAGTFTFGNRYNEMTSNHFNLAWFDRYLKGKLVVDADGNAVPSEGRNEAEERAYRQAIAKAAFDRLAAESFDATVDTHNISQGFYDPVQAATNQDPIRGGNVPYKVEGLPIADRLSFYYRSVCFISAPDYVSGNGGIGDAIFARGDTTAEGDMRSQGCPVTLANPDADGDGVLDAADQCPATPAGEAVDADGCSDSQKDSDSDGVSDDLDQCAATPSGETADADGCSDSQKDSDSDGVSDDLDQCAGTPAGTPVDSQGCAVPSQLTVSLAADPTSGDVTDGALTVNFTATAQDSDPDAGTIRYVFYFGDGSNSGLITNPGTISHDYDKAGTYEASVVVVDENNNSARDTVTITTTTTVTVDPDPIVVDAKLSVQLSSTSVPVTATFDASGSTAPDGATYRFDFGDGKFQQGTSKLATHAYALAGEYTVTLTVTAADDADNTDSVTAVITVGSGQQTTVQLVVSPTTAKIGELVSFDASASIAAEGTSITSYHFDFADGNSETRTVSEFGAQAGIATHAYQTSGSFTPVVTVTDSANTAKQASVQVKVFQPGTPEAPAVNTASSGGGSMGWLALLPMLAAGLRRRIRKA